MNTQESNALKHLLELIEAEKMEEAAAAFTQLAAQDGQQAAAAIGALLTAGRGETAKAWLDQAKDGAWLEAARALVALTQGDVKAAREHSGKAIAAGLDESVIYDVVAQLAQKLELYTEALQFYMMAQRSSKSDARLLQILALLMRTGRMAEAYRLLDKIEQKRPQIGVAALKVLADCVEGDTARIAQDLEKLDPADDSVAAVFARLQAGLKLGQDVSPVLEQLQEADETQADLWIADARAVRGEREAAGAALDRIAAREAESTDSQLRYDIARRYEHLESYAKALEQYEKVNIDEMIPRRGMLVEIEKAHCIMKTGGRAKALQMFDDIANRAAQRLMENPAETEMYLVRLRCFVELGRKMEARQLADFMLTIAKDDQTREMIRRAIK